MVLPDVFVPCSVGYGDITASCTLEVWVAIIIIICGLAIFASILTSLVEIVEESSREAQKQRAMRSKLTDVQHWMEHRQIEPGLRSSILRFYGEDWGRLQEKADTTILSAPLS
jgi:hypothetical protein